MSQTDEQTFEQIFQANFEFVETSPIEATFSFSPDVQDLNYIHYQDVASTSWNINHRLGKYPSVTVVDSSGNMVLSDVTYIDANNVQVNFSAAFAGRAYLN